MALDYKRNVKCVLHWQIKKFSMGIYEDQIDSPIFNVLNFDKTAWLLEFFPISAMETLETSIYLSRSSTCGSSTEQIAIGHEISIVTADGSHNKISINEIGHFEKGQSIMRNSIMRAELFKNKNVFLPNDTLNIQCSIWQESASSAISSPIHVYAISGPKTLTRAFRWSIRNLSTLLVQRPVNSPVIQFCDGTSCSLSFCVNLNNDFDFEVVKNGRMSVSCKVFLLDLSGKRIHPKEDAFLHEPDLDPHLTNEKFISDYFKRSYLKENKSVLWPDDTLTLDCEVTVCNSSTFDSKVENETSGLESHTDAFILTSLQHLYTEKKLCDVTLSSSEGKLFSAHKSVLGAVSPVYLTMFETNMAEKKNDAVDITDIDGVTLNLLLNFVYFDKIENLQHQSASKLYFAADKYQILPLKEKCLQIIISSLSVSNVCDSLALADLHQDLEIKDAAHSFLFRNKSEIENSDKWKDFITVRSDLALKTLNEVFFRKSF